LYLKRKETLIEWRIEFTQSVFSIYFNVGGKIVELNNTTGINTSNILYTASWSEAKTIVVSMNAGSNNQSPTKLGSKTTRGTL
jgi:hypothetical protein